MSVRRLAAALLYLMVAACSSTSAVPTAASTPRVSPSVTRQPSPTTPAPAELALTPLVINCGIPVSGLVASDEDGVIDFPASAWGDSFTTGGLYFDMATYEWLPVRRQAVSPDGRRYAYTEDGPDSPGIGSHLHIVDAVTRKDLIATTAPFDLPFVVADFASDGVYLVVDNEGKSPGVWRVTPSTGGWAKVAAGNYVPAGPTWFSVVDPSDPHPALFPESGLPRPDRVDRRDTSGRTTTWFYRPGFAVAWAAFAGLSQIVVEASRTSPVPTLEFWLVGGPNQATRMAAGPLDPSNPYFPLYGGINTAISDSYGVWIGAPDGLYLVGPTGVILRVFGSAAYPANGCVLPA